MLLSASLNSLGKQIDAHCSLVSHPADLHSFLLTLLDDMTTRLSGARISDVLLANAKCTHLLPKLKTSVVFRPEKTAHIEAAASRIRFPEPSSLAPEDRQPILLGSMANSNTPEPTTIAATSFTNVVTADRDKFYAVVSCETEPGDQHTGISATQSRIPASGSRSFGDFTPSTLDTMHIDVISDDAQTLQNGDMQINSCPMSDEAKMTACSVEQYDTVSPNSAVPCGPDASDEAVTDAPGQGSCMSLFSGPPSPQLRDESIAIDARFDDVCTPDEITQASSSTKVITSLEISQSPVQGDQDLDAMSEIDTSELDVHRASESDFSPKSFASSTTSTVPSTSSMSVPHEQSYGPSDEIMEIEPEIDSFVHSQPVTDLQPHTPTDGLASSKVDFRTLNPSLRPQYRVDYPRSSQIICRSVGMTEWDTYRPAAETGTTEWASQAWTTDDMLDFEQTKSSFTKLERDEPNRSTAYERDPKRLQGPAKFESFVNANPHQGVHEMTQQKVTASLSRASLTANTSSVPATSFERVAAASTPPPYFCVTISVNNNKSCDTAEAEVIPHNYHAGQTHNGNAYPRAISQDGEDRRVHTYRPNLHTIAALVVEERNVTKSESTDPEPGVIDTSFIPQAVRQHAESQEKSRQAANQGSSQRGKKAKKSKKKTGRLNKERACVEKVLQPANEEAVDIPDTLDRAEEKATDSAFPNDGDAQDLASKRKAKKNEKRRIRRQQISRGSQAEHLVVSTSTPIDEQIPKRQDVNSGETTGLQGKETEGYSCSEVPYDNCDEADLNTKPLEDGSRMGCAVATLKLVKEPSINTLEAPDDHIKSPVAGNDTGAIIQKSSPTGHNAIVAALDDTNVAALKAAPISPEEDETISAKGNLPVTVHDTIAETTTDGDTDDGCCHAAAAQKVVGQPNHLGKSTLTPILEEVEPETDPSVNDAGVESCHTVIHLAAPEPADPSSYRKAMGAGTLTPSNVEADGDMQLTHFVQHEPLEQRAIEYYTETTAYHEYPHPTQAYNHGTWPNYDAEPVHNYYYPIEPNSSYHYPFSNQLPEYCTPYYDDELYAGYPQPQYFEPFYDQNYEFCHQLAPSRYEPKVYATPHRARISWKEWQPYAERYPGQPFGTRTHMKEQKDKPWYLQTLGYEEELEEEFQTGEFTQRERTRRSCRKYGL